MLKTFGEHENIFKANIHDSPRWIFSYYFKYQTEITYSSRKYSVQRIYTMSSHM